jgi:hypothetical protein
VLRDLSGHASAARFTSRAVWNYFEPFQRDVLTEGLVLAIEPLIS